MPKRDASVILLSVGPGAAADLGWRRLRSAGLLSAGTLGFGHEDEEFLDETLDAPAQLALDRRRVRQERAADGQQLPLPGLGNTPLPCS